MKKSAKKLISLLLAVIMIVAAVPMIEASAKTSGNLTYEVKDGEVTITDCKESASGKLTIPSKLSGYPVTKIGQEAFYSCTKITSIKIPDSVKSIGDDAFYYCTSLESINIPKGVKKINMCTFSDCRKLKSVTIPNTVTFIATAAFYNCSALKSLTIPGSVKT